MARTKRTVISDAHQAAVDEYFRNGFRKTDALRVAGIASPEKHTWEVFSRPEVLAEVERRHRIAREKSEGGIERLIKEYERIAYLNMGRYGHIDTDTGHFVINLNEIAEEDEEELLSVIAEFTTEVTGGTVVNGKLRGGTLKCKIKPWDKMKAMDSLARHYGMYNDQLEVKGEMTLIELIQQGRKRSSAAKAESDDEAG